MAWLRTALALVLTWTLAVSARGWEPVARIRGLRILSPDEDEAPIPVSYKKRDKSDDYTDDYAVGSDNYSAESDDYAVDQVGDYATNLDLYGNHGFQVEYMDVTAPRQAPRAPCGNSPTSTTTTTTSGPAPCDPTTLPTTTTSGPTPCDPTTLPTTTTSSPTPCDPTTLPTTTTSGPTPCDPTTTTSGPTPCDPTTLPTTTTSGPTPCDPTTLPTTTTSGPTPCDPTTLPTTTTSGPTPCDPTTLPTTTTSGPTPCDPTTLPTTTTSGPTPCDPTTLPTTTTSGPTPCDPTTLPTTTTSGPTPCDPTTLPTTTTSGPTPCDPTTLPTTTTSGPTPCDPTTLPTTTTSSPTPCDPTTLPTTTTSGPTPCDPTTLPTTTTSGPTPRDPTTLPTTTTSGPTPCDPTTLPTTTTSGPTPCDPTTLPTTTTSGPTPCDPTTLPTTTTSGPTPCDPTTLPTTTTSGPTPCDPTTTTSGPTPCGPTTTSGAHPPPPTQPINYLIENPKPSGCSIPKEQQLRCGHYGISSSDCKAMGCCVDITNLSCFYAMNDCTKDKDFVFAIYKDSTVVPVDPTKLVIPGTSCGPVIVNERFAIYKFSVSDCGTRVYQIGDTLIYLAEVHTPVLVLNLKYGFITRDDPVRFLVECRYSEKGPSSVQSLASIGFMVKTPIMDHIPSAVVSDGRFAIELRIAEDDTYSKYYPHDHKPLHLLLGKRVYLEVHLKSSESSKATLKVNYCLAYPRSAKNALVLIYEGCTNRLDPHISILQVLPKNRHQRRFVVNAFLFMDIKTNKYLDEEIYFMCSTELCMSVEKTCEERCFDGVEWKV